MVWPGGSPACRGSWSGAIDLPAGQSAFVWGARQTGKSTWLRERFPDSVYLDLLDFDIRLPLNARPTRLGEQLASMPESRTGPVVIDEIQKVPG
jgi:predicted AAA+ superfamily ATPase